MHRRALKLSVAALARKVEMTEGAIRAIEAGATKNLYLGNGLKLAQLFGVSPWWLAGEIEPSADSQDSATPPPAQALAGALFELEARLVKDFAGQIEALRNEVQEMNRDLISSLQGDRPDDEPQREAHDGP
jgi:transcriptional regulator with XRE-family HTH domain